jgi:hypothetical protein
MIHNFTTKQKIKIYKCAIVELKEQHLIKWDDSRCGLCLTLGDAARGLYGISGTTNYDEDFKGNYPEVFKYKPTHCFNYMYWFSRSTRGINKRIHILETVIQELENGKETKE